MPRKYYSRATGLFSSFYCLAILTALASCVVSSTIPTQDYALAKRQSQSSDVLTVFQVYEPVLTPAGPSDQYGCVYTKVLMEHSFANSYEHPFVGNYTPPPCSFNRVNMNLTVTSAGRQFDRLGIMYLGDVEVFRTSTAEPTARGIVWTYVKEMQQYNALWRTDQKIIFDLGNLINNIYTAPFNATLTATFFTVPDAPDTADVILPISALRSANNQGSAFTFPDQNASISYVVPRNIQRAVISLSANGQIAEEFWYTNVFSSEVNTFADTTGRLNGYSPFREVQLFIDGRLAGVSWPFPVIFTGGIVPGFWRPIVGIDAFDLREHEIDVTPWLPLLCDGTSHTFEIRIAGLSDDGQGHATLTTVPSYWVVTGKIFIFLDTEGSVTTGRAPSINSPTPQFILSSTVTQNDLGQNETLVYDTSASRYLNIRSTIRTSRGVRSASWTQRLSYSNHGSLTQQGLVAENNQNTKGQDTSSSGYRNNYGYPIDVLSSFYVSPARDVSINGTLNRGLEFDVFGPSVFPSGVQNFNVTTPSIFNLPGERGYHGINIRRFPAFGGSQLSTTQSCFAGYFSSASGNRSYTFGTTEQDFSFRGVAVGSSDASFELYSRHVKAVNSTVVEDSETLAGQTFEIPVGAPRAVTVQPDYGEFSVRALLGRGPGQVKGEGRP